MQLMSSNYSSLKSNNAITSKSLYRNIDRRTLMILQRPKRWCRSCDFFPIQDARSWLRVRGNTQKEDGRVVYLPWCFQLQREMAEKLSFCSQNEDYPRIGNEKLQTSSLARFQRSGSSIVTGHSRVYVLTREFCFISLILPGHVKCIILWPERIWILHSI